MKLAELILIIILLFSLRVEGQINETKRYVSIGLSPLSLIDPMSSTIEGVLEIRAITQLGIVLKYGYQFEELKIGDSLSDEFTDYRYVERKLELRYYLYEDNDRIELYSGIELAMNNEELKRRSGFYRRRDLGFSYQGGELEIEKLVLRAKFGLQFHFGKNWLLSMSGGTGLRKVKVSYETEIENESQAPFRELYIPRYEWDGIKTKFDIYVGIQVGYKLIKMKTGL